jgi:hypothetical protein
MVLDLAENRIHWTNMEMIMIPRDPRNEPKNGSRSNTDMKRSNLSLKDDEMQTMGGKDSTTGQLTHDARSPPNPRINRKKQCIRPRTDSEMIISQLLPPWPMAVGKLIGRNDLTFQWYTTLSSRELKENEGKGEKGAAPQYDDPLKAYLPCWTDRDEVYSGPYPRQTHHEPYTSRHTKMELSQSDILIRDFNLTKNGYLPTPIIDKCIHHASIHWPHEDKRSRILSQFGLNDRKKVFESGWEVSLDDDEKGPVSRGSLNNKKDGTTMRYRRKETSILPGTRNSLTLSRTEDIRNAITRAARHRAKLNGFRTCKEIAEPIRMYLHTTRSLYTNAIHVDERDIWHSTDEEDTTLGAKNGSISLFITGKSTWVNLIDDTIKRRAQSDTLWKMIKKLGESKPTRIAMLLCEDDVPDYAGETSANDLTCKARMYVLLSLRPGMVLLNDSDINGHKHNNARRNDETLMVLVMETGMTPAIDVKGLQEELRNNEIDVLAEDLRVPGDLEMEEKEDLFRTYRTRKIHMWPSLLWFMKSPGITKEESCDDSPNQRNYIKAHKTLQEHDPLLGQLGVPPRHLGKHLINMGLNSQHVTRENVKLISKIILDASLKAYMRYESWKRRKKYRIE